MRLDKPCFFTHLGFMPKLMLLLYYYYIYIHVYINIQYYVNVDAGRFETYGRNYKTELIKRGLRKISREERENMISGLNINSLYIKII